MMKIKRILFLEPKNTHLHIYSKFKLPRLGSTLLATIMRNLGYETKVLFLTQKEILNHAFHHQCLACPDTSIIAISTITNTANTAYELADYYRQKGIPVIMGGPHITALPKEAITHANYCICGEGENSLPKLITAIENGDQNFFIDVDGLVWMDDKKNIHINPPGDFIEDLDSLPYPDFSLLDMGTEKMGAVDEKPLIPIQTSRGCPFDCSFCSVTATFGRKYRFRSTKSVIDELCQYDSSKNKIFFYDDNFTANKRRTKALLKEMIRLDLDFNWSTQVRVDVAKDSEMLDLMVAAGCDTLYIGFESIDPAALKEMKKQQTREDIEWAIREIRKRKIHIHGMFVFGFDADTPRSLQATVKFAIKQKIDTTQFLILTPFPGTKFYKVILAQDRIIDQNWSEHDAHHVKFLPKHFTPFQLQMAQVKAHAKFYKFRYVFNRLLHGRLSAFIIGIYANILNRKWLKREKLYLQRIKLIDQKTKVKN